jgi:hypothetical protein
MRGRDDARKSTEWMETCLDPPGLRRLARQVAEGLACRVGEPAAAAHPRAVEALPERVGQQRKCDERPEEAVGQDQEGLLEDPEGYRYSIFRGQK